MACYLVEMLVDNCAEVIEDTQDLGLIGPLLADPQYTTCSTPLTTTPDCSNTSVTPSTGLTISCSIIDPACTLLGFSPDNINPALTNVLFAITYRESVTVSEANNGQCVITTNEFTRLKMVQMTTSTVTQPLTYSCLLDNYACECRLIYLDGDDDRGHKHLVGCPDDGCHLICNATFCVEFISTTTVKQEIAATPCPTPTCDPFPPVACPPSTDL